MRISSSTVGMASARSFTSVSTRVSRMVISNGRVQTGVLSGDPEGSQTQKGSDETKTGEKENQQGNLTATYEEMKSKNSKVSSGNLRSVDAARVREQLMEIRQQCINYLIDILFPGRRRSLFGEDVTGTNTNSAWQSQGSGSSTSETVVGSLGMNIKTFAFSREYYHEETENTGFSTQGTVRCADGREISFGLNVEMSRSFQEYYEENITMIQASMCDPLVINLDGNIADLSDQTFLFDLDGDGQEDEINRLSAGSGFLALDKNGDGVINDGSELFGTKSGNGFADLSAYDTDHNGFIDEGDEIWNQLKIWVMDEDGQQRLYTLAEKGVGAICLQNAATDFSITGEDNQAKGMIRRTGFFLYENGSAGTVQHVDMAIHEKTPHEGTLYERAEQEKIRQNQSKYEKWLYDMAM